MLLDSIFSLHIFIGAPISPADRQQVDRCLDAVRERLEPAEFQSAYLERQVQPIDQIIAFALGKTDLPNLQTKR
jgi:hypothetical protein